MCCSRHTAAFGFAERSGDPMLTLPAIVEEILGQSSRRPQAVALEEVSGHRMTYERLARDAAAVPAGPLGGGLRPCARIAFATPSTCASTTLALRLLDA